VPQLALAPGPIERVRADVAVVPLFAGERPLRAAAGRVDWRLCGRLSHLLAAGRLVGAFGEAVLIPGGGGMCAPRVLGVGAGRRDQIDAELFERWVEDALARARGLAARRAVIALPELEIALGERLGVFARSVARISLPEVVEIAPEPTEAPGTVDWMRGAARRSRPEGLEIAAPVDPVSPHGVTEQPTRARSSQESAGRSTR
jgi:hypothetical protein